ncbi:MAG: hypothetical protein IAE78_27185, partial [Myxococcus sp.]|nr:hypothetical protein [Myxococcus sp.]
ASCTSNPNSACQNGVIDCSSGSGVCVNGGNKANGTACTGGVCNAGSCNPCSAGASCSPANPCKSGVIACGSGAPVCTESGNLPLNTACPGGVCSAGTCVACAAGTACATNPNPCMTGVTACVAGGPSCVDGASRPNLTACPGGRCISGACCTGCISGSICYAGTSNTRCGTDGMNCFMCGGGTQCIGGLCEDVCSPICQ